MEKFRGIPYDHDIAFRQFMELYSELTEQGGLVYVLPSVGNFQDQTYVANLGCYLPHVTAADVIILANFKSEPRQGEDEVGLAFFQQMGYTILRPMTTFEGEADLKYLRENIYVGGYGIRTDLRSYNWISEATDAKIIPIELDDPRLYHFDCVFLPLSGDKAMVATTALKSADVRKLERYVDIISVPEKYVHDAWTNGVMIGNEVLHTEINRESDRAFRNFVIKYGYEPVLIDLSEFEKSGAALSCMVLHLNYLARTS
jgi:N-dimethylarginine dimethylaminohydrolase